MVTSTESNKFFEIENPGCNACYTFTVRCVSDCDDTSFGILSNQLKVTTENCCQQPGNLAQPIVNMDASTSQVEVSWAPCTSGSVSGFRDDCEYDLQYTQDNNLESYIETTTSNEYEMSFLQGMNYCFRVRARNSCATGMWSHETCRNECSTPNKAEVPALVRKTDDEITIKWDNCKIGALGATKECTDCHYELEITGPYDVKRTEHIYNRNQYSIVYPVPTEDYSFRIRCKSSGCGDGEYSEPFKSSICPAPDAPECPKELCPESKKDFNGKCRDNKITVQWQHATGCENVSHGDHMCHYELTFQNSDMAQAETVFTNNLEFTLYSPEDNKEYEFCLVACNECGKSPKSECLKISRSTC